MRRKEEVRLKFFKKSLLFERCSFGFIKLEDFSNILTEKLLLILILLEINYALQFE